MLRHTCQPPDETKYGYLDGFDEALHLAKKADRRPWWTLVWGKGPPEFARQEANVRRGPRGAPAPDSLV